jgi:HEAT repeat protein
LINFLKNGKSDARRAAAKSLCIVLVPRALEPLILALKDPDPEVRWRAAMAVGNFKDSRIIELLQFVLLNDESGNVRGAAAYTLSKIQDPRIEKMFAAILKSKDYRLRHIGAWALVTCRYPYAIDLLIPTLADKNPQVASVALDGLIGKGASSDSLIEALKSKNPQIRSSAALILKRIKDPNSVDKLVTVLRGNRLEARCQAALILGEIQDNRAVEHLIKMLNDEEAEARQAAAMALGEIRDPLAVEPLICKLKDNNFEVRKKAAHALGTIGDPKAVVPLIDALEDKNLSYAGSAAWALGRIRDPSAVNPLIIALKHNNSELSMWAAQALGEINDRVAIEPLVGTLGDTNIETKAYAIESLGKLKATQAVEVLIAALKDKHLRVRRSAVEALGKIQDPRAIVPLLVFLRVERAISQTARNALAQMGSPAVDPLIAILNENGPKGRNDGTKTPGNKQPQNYMYPTNENQDADKSMKPYRDELLRASKTKKRQRADRQCALARSHAAWILGEIRDARATKPLIAALNDKDAEVINNAMSALVKMGPLAVDSLAAATKDFEPNIRRRVLGRLTKIKSPRAIEQLIEAVNDEASGIRHLAIKALGEIKEKKAVEPLIVALSNIDPEVRVAAARALGKINDPRSIRPLIKALNDKHRKVVISAADALWRTKDASVAKALIKLWKKPNAKIRSRAAGFLVKMGISAVDPLIAAMNDEDSYTRWRAAWVIGKIREALAEAEDLGAVIPLTHALQDKNPEVRLSAAWALGEFYDQRAIAPLTALQNDEDSGVRRIAEEVLTRITEFEKFNQVPCYNQPLRAEKTRRVKMVPICGSRGPEGMDDRADPGADTPGDQADMGDGDIRRQGGSVIFGH